MNDPAARTDGETPILPTEPLPLEYFAANEPERRKLRAVTLCSLLLLAGWLPYVCGIVNVLAVTQSGSAEAIYAHHRGAAIFMGAGLLTSLVSLAGFGRLRHRVGMGAAVLVMIIQGSIAACIGVNGMGPY